MRKRIQLRMMTTIIVLIMTIVSIMAPLTVCAQSNDEQTSGRRVVRIGWHEPPYFMIDQNGRKSGYSYEYQRKVAAYTRWEYDYVEGTWSELLEKLKKGEIDVLGNISYSEERAKEILYTSIPMGTEAYYVFISRDNEEITSDDLSSLNGKRIGVTKGSIQKDYFIEWEKNHGVRVDLVELTTPDEESMKKLGKELDGFVTVDVYGKSEDSVPLCKIGSSDFYFAVNKNKPEILTELDEALNRIQDENKYFDQQLYDKYLKINENNRYMSTDEKKWLSDHKTIKVGYQNNYLAFCAQDPSTGELTGALKDFLDYAADTFENAHLIFEPVCFETVAEAIDALKKGDIDCMFPSNLTSYDAETLGVMMTPTLMHTEMDAVVRESEQKEFIKKKHVNVAVNEGNTNYDLFISEKYPSWNRKYYKDTPTGLEAVANKEADCVIISNYRYSNISKQCERLHLTTVYTGVDMDYSFAVCDGNMELYSILARVTDVVPDAIIHSALTYYSTEDVKTNFIDMIKDNLVIILAVISVVLFIILILVLRSIKAEKKIREGKHLLKDLNRRVFVDALTSVRNKGAFSNYMEKLQERLDQGEEFEFAIGMFDCNNLKNINDEYGHDKGDIYLKAACQLICKVFDHSPVFRIGGDEFAVVLEKNDFINREELLSQFEERRKEISDSADNKWEEIHIAVGIAVYDPENDSGATDTMRRADKIMYDNKRIVKEQEKEINTKK